MLFFSRLVKKIFLLPKEREILHKGIMKQYSKPARSVRAAYVLTALLSALLFAAFPAAASDGLPSRPLEMSIVFSPGGALDIVARALAREAESLLGRSVTPVNRPGGGGAPGVAQLAGETADGSRLGAVVSNALIFLPHRNAVPYRPLADLEPVLSFGQAAPVLVTTPRSPWTDVDGFLAATRERKGELRIGVPGLGSPSHIALSMISRGDPSLAWRFVPFSGPGEAEAALLGGHLDAAVSGALPRIRNGQLKPLLTLAAERLTGLPDVPSLTDRGFADPGRGDSTFLLLAPAGTPEAVLDALESAFLRAADSEAYRRAVEGFSVTPTVRGRAETRRFLREAWDEETRILRQAGMGDEPATPPE